ncbi:PilZ domain-containing protein [Neisseriaceae bacterium JH1-16]|nr:PilZ domain-containing protein [Neisseriaceae bacterium JH1-16]
MNYSFLPRELRSARRIPMGCKARIKSLFSGQTAYGHCVDLSVDGIALRSSFVPQHGERLSIVLLPPPAVGELMQPFYLDIEVRRCSEIVSGVLYEIGAIIMERAS